MVEIEIIEGMYVHTAEGTNASECACIGDHVVVSEAEADRLVRMGVAVAVATVANGCEQDEVSDDTDHTGSPDNGCDGGSRTTGHMDPDQLENMTKAQLTSLAEQMGVTISPRDNKAEIIAKIVAVEVTVEEEEQGPDLSAAAPVV